MSVYLRFVTINSPWTKIKLEVPFSLILTRHEVCIWQRNCEELTEHKPISKGTSRFCRSSSSFPSISGRGHFCLDLKNCLWEIPSDDSKTIWILDQLEKFPSIKAWTRVFSSAWLKTKNQTVRCSEQTLSIKEQLYSHDMNNLKNEPLNVE